MPVNDATHPSYSENMLDLTALELAKAIRARQVSSEEVTRGYFERIRSANPRLNAFVDLGERQAIRTARQKDAMTGRDEALPLFHGVPIGVKDMSFARGFYTRFGSRALKYLWMPVDDLTVRSLRHAGFVIVGKTATSEAGALPITEPDIHPATRNPWNEEFTAGGSSGGAAAAVAAGLLPIAHGSDGAGSIRIPASFCNLFGFKPSRGVVRNPYGHNDARLLYTCGALTRSVEDAAALLDVMNNGVRLQGSKLLEMAMQSPRPLRVRYVFGSALVKAGPEQEEATRRVLKLLEELGHTVEPGVEVSGTLDDFLPLWQTLVAQAPLMRAKLQPTTRWLVDGAKHVDPGQVEALHDRLERMIDETFADADVLVSPSVALPPPRVGAFAALDPEQAFRAAAALGGLTAPYNITGQPAASIPAGFSADRLPIGVQLVGRRWQDGELLALAHQLESALPFSTRPLGAAVGKVS